MIDTPMDDMYRIWLPSLFRLRYEGKLKILISIF